MYEVADARVARSGAAAARQPRPTAPAQNVPSAAAPRKAAFPSARSVKLVWGRWPRPCRSRAPAACQRRLGRRNPKAERAASSATSPTWNPDGAGQEGEELRDAGQEGEELRDAGQEGWPHDAGQTCGAP